MKSYSAVILGLIATLVLVVLWELAGHGVEPKQGAYFLSRYLTDNVSVQLVLIYFVVSVFLGMMTMKPQHVAIGMVLPFPLAFLVEVLLDSTSHNLIPIEVILYWTPALGLALLGGYFGQFAKRVVTRSNLPWAERQRQ